MGPDIFTSRGITPPWAGGRVAQRQGFARYEGADWRQRRDVIAALEELYGSDEHPDMGKARELWGRAVERADRRFGTHAVTRYLEESWSPEVEPYLNAARGRLPWQARQAWMHWLRKALAVNGWLMPRHATMPDSEVGAFRARPVAQLRPDAPVVMGTGWEWHQHSHDLAPQERDAHEAKLCEWAAAPRGRILDQRTKNGRVEYLIPTGHLHPDTGELVVPVEGRHAHWSHAKYLYTPGDTALRLGTSPRVLERGWGGPEDLFVVVLEGTLKMCSVVEAGYPAIDAGSVTLWHGGVERLDVDEDGIENLYVHTELEEFAARHLEGRRVAVVCDSDWHSNPLVRDQTERVTTILREAGADAISCAPPEGASRGWQHPITGVEMRVKRGVDDWLGEHEPGDRHEAMLELVYQERTGDAELTADHPALAGIRADGRKTIVELLRRLGETAAPGTQVAPYTEARLMASMRRAKGALQRARRHAEERGLLEEIQPAKRAQVAGDHYMHPPLLRVLLPEALPRYQTGTLREWLSSSR